MVFAVALGKAIEGAFLEGEERLGQRYEIVSVSFGRTKRREKEKRSSAQLLYFSLSSFFWSFWERSEYQKGLEARQVRFRLWSGWSRKSYC